MNKKRLAALLALSFALLLLLTCTGQQTPFQLQDATVNVVMANSSGHRDADTITDTVENHVLIGMVGYLPSYISSVKVVIATAADTDTTLTYLKGTAWADTQWIKIAFHSIGTRIVTIHVSLGATEKTVTTTIVVLGRPVVISNQSTSFSVDPTDTAQLFVTPRDTGKFSFQWVKDGTRITGANSDTLIIYTVLPANVGVYTCVVKDQWGDSAVSTPAVLTINASSNHKPQLSVTGVRNIISAQACSLSLSTTDADSGQTFVYAMPRAPQGATLTANIFKWTPPAAFLGIDTVIFAVTDNGKPPMSDTVPVYITVSESLSLQITTLLPPATSVVPGSSTALTVVASGTVPIAYQWYYNGTAISGATTSSYSKTWGASDGGFYKVVVSNAGGKDSSATQVTVCPRVTAGLGPNTSIVINSSSALSVTATGTAPLAYQWYVNGTAITGATTNSYSKTWASGDGGVYKVVVTNSAGSDSSQTAVTINSSITTPLPGTTNITQGSTTALTVAASGTPPITYQWFYNGTAITGATGASYSKTWGGSDGGIYKVVVTNPTGTDSSSTQVTVNPVIATGLAASISVGQGNSTALSVVVTGSAPITYQWYYNGTAITGAATNTYSKTWGATDGGIYKVVVSNAAGKDSSSTQLGVSPKITAGLGVSTSIAIGSTTPLSVTATGTATLTYQWYLNGAAITGATTNSYSKTWASGDGGVYKVIVTNGAGSDSSKTTVAINSSITAPLSGTTNITQGSTTALTVAASGTPPITYQWYYNGTAITAATSASYSKTWGGSDGGIYKVVVTNPTGTDSSSTQVTVSPAITTGLGAGTSMTQGSSTALSVTVSGTLPISYQWYFNGTAVSGANTSTYSKTWGAADGGIYKVVVTNAAGKDSSTTQVTVSPLITAGLGANTSISINSTTALSVTAAGTATVAYQWYLNGTAIASATSSSYSKTWGAADGGVYKVVVTNAAGSDSSKTTVTINSSITTPLPGTTNVVQGSATPLAIVASGTPPITYQWYYDGTAITGATNASYSKTWGASDGGVYKVVVTNPTGKDSSSTQVTVAPVITAGLSAGTSVAQAGSTALSVTASGTATITYQWYLNGTAITGATTNSYSKTWGAADGGTYKVVATNAAGKDSSTTQVTVSPMITAGLGANTSISINSTTALSVTAAGTATLAYQWYLNGTAITGATSNSYSKTWGAGDGGVYKVVVTNAAGSDSSKTTVTINSSITTPLPGTTNVVQGSTTPLTIVASGTPPITYQWYYNGTAITGATSASYSKTWGAADGGVYKVVVTNPTGKDSSSTQLAVASTAPTGASANPTAICPGGSSSLSVIGGSLGTGASWKWYTDAGCTTPVTGTSAGATITVSPTSTTTYYVRAEGTSGSTTTASAAVTVNTASTAPTGASANPTSVCSGNASSVSVTGGSLGTGASWKWYTDPGCNTPITGTNTGAVVSVSPTSTATYYVRAEGTCGNTATGSVAVTVNISSAVPSGASANPSSINSGNSSSLSVVGGVLGTGASWIWYSGSVGGTSAGSGASIAVSPTATTTYYVRAEGGCGAPTASVSVSVTVNIPPTINTQPLPATVNIGAASATFSVVLNAGATPSPTYAWYKEGSSNVLSTTAGLTATGPGGGALTYADSGNYYVVITNAGGSVTSNHVKLTIHDNVSPVLTLKGSLDTTFLVTGTSTYTDPGILTATDDRDGNVAAAGTPTSTVLSTTPGVYTYKWTVTDLSGNTASVTRTVRGEGWQSAAPDLSGVTVSSAAMTSNNSLYIGCADASGNLSVMKLGASGWAQVGAAIQSNGYNMKLQVANDTVYAAYNTAGNMSNFGIKKLAGSTWVDVGLPTCSDGTVVGNTMDFQVTPAGVPIVIYTPKYGNMQSVTFDNTNCILVPAFSGGTNTIVNGAATPLIAVNSAGKPFVAFNYSADGDVEIETYDNVSSLAWTTAGAAGEISAATWPSKLVIDQSGVTYLLGTSSSGYNVWRSNSNIGLVTSSTGNATDIMYSSNTQKVYSGYIDGSGNCIMKEYESGSSSWQVFPVRANGVVPVSSPTSTGFSIFVGNKLYYVIYTKTNASVSTLKYQVQN